jgi:hypothetical protein
LEPSTFMLGLVSSSNLGSSSLSSLVLDIVSPSD